MRILVTGSQPYTRPELVAGMLHAIWGEAAGEEIVVVRGVTGDVERMAGQIAREQDAIGFVDEPHAEGNQFMVDLGADSLWAEFEHGFDQGNARDLIARAEAAGIPCLLSTNR